MSRLPMVFGLGILGLALIVGGGASQDAKKDKDDKGKIKGQLPPGFKDLELSKEQVNKIYTLQTEYKKKINELQTKINELKKMENQEVFKVLTDDQRDKYLKAKGIDTKDKGVKDKGEKDKKDDAKKDDKDKSKDKDK
jgi:TolA-binding protein